MDLPVDGIAVDYDEVAIILAETRGLPAVPVRSDYHSTWLSNVRAKAELGWRKILRNHETQTACQRPFLAGKSLPLDRRHSRRTRSRPSRPQDRRALSLFSPYPLREENAPGSLPLGRPRRSEPVGASMVRG